MLILAFVLLAVLFVCLCLQGWQLIQVRTLADRTAQQLHHHLEAHTVAFDTRRQALAAFVKPGRERLRQRLEQKRQQAQERP